MGRRAALLVASFALLILAGCSDGTPEAGTDPRSGAERPTAGPLPAPPSPDPVIVAEAAVPLIEVFDQPGDTSPAPRTVTSPRASGSVFPMSSVTSRASSSRFAQSTSRIAITARARFCGGVARHAG